MESIREELKSLTGVDAASCYQCRKCSMGCPVSPLMRVKISELIRMIQLDMREEALSADTFWYCVSCETCATRCPQDINLTRLMDGLREIAMREGRKPEVPEVPLFFRFFMDSVLRRGRVFELGAVMRYNLVTTDFFKDIDLFPLLLRRGKISFLPPPKIKTASLVKRIYKETKEKAG